jgi:hypothetical protein
MLAKVVAVQSIQRCIKPRWLIDHLKLRFTPGGSLGGILSQISRRAWLEGVALVSAAAMLASTPAEAKVTKAAVHYRDSPKGMQMCHMCKYYIASGGRSAGMCMGMMGTGACQLVQGSISPMGWCDLYSPA